MRQPVSDQLASELERHKGRWVAIFQNRLVATGDSVEEVIRLAQEQHVTDPTVFRVPAHPDRAYLF